MPFAGGMAEQVTKQGGWTPYESGDGTTLVYSKFESSALFAMPLSGGPERQVLDWVSWRAFVPAEDGIYFIGRLSNGQYPLQFFRFSSQTSHVLTKIDGTIFPGLSVSSDRTTVLFAKSVKFGSNLK